MAIGRSTSERTKMGHRRLGGDVSNRLMNSQMDVQGRKNTCDFIMISEENEDTAEDGSTQKKHRKSFDIKPRSSNSAQTEQRAATRKLQVETLTTGLTESSDLQGAMLSLSLLSFLPQVIQLTKSILLATAFFSLPLAQACDINGSSSLTCRSLNLLEIPSLESGGDEIKSFEFSGNKLFSLDDNAFFEYPTISSLFLYSNQITEVGVDAFEGLDELRTLDLSNNEISTLDPDTVQENTKLTSLSLKNNPIQLTSTALLNSDSINQLDLTKCNLTSVKAVNFAGLTNLNTLILRHNSLESLPTDFFDSLPSLKRVYLHGNPWRCDDVTQKLMLSRQDVIADYKKIQCVTSDVAPRLPAVSIELSSEKPKERVTSDVPDDQFKPNNYDDGGRSDKLVQIQSLIRDDILDVIDSSVESDEEDEDDDAADLLVNEVKEEITHHIRSTMIYLNISLIFVIAILGIGILLIFLRHRRNQVIKTDCEAEDEYQGYMIPRPDLVPASAIAVNHQEESYEHHVYERIH